VRCRFYISLAAWLAGGRPSHVVAYKKPRTSSANPVASAGAFVEHPLEQFSLLAHLYGSQPGLPADRTPVPTDVPPSPDLDKEHSVGTVLVQPGDGASPALDRKSLERATSHVLKDRCRRRETVVGARNQPPGGLWGRRKAIT
jgi:hypothetical protein